MSDTPYHQTLNEAKTSKPRPRSTPALWSQGQR